jgi:glycosyltransferase involved in cell wall biosynthesis
MENLGATDNRILISDQKVPPDALAQMYNVADCTINISDAEGFGLATLESLSSGVPIIVNMTGGLQEQVTDGEEWFGIGIEPASKTIIGSQEVPYIYEDRLNKEDFLNALRKMYNMTPEERQELGLKGREHVIKNYNFIDFEKKWVDLMDNIHEKYGSWENRKHYKPWTFEEIS